MEEYSGNEADTMSKVFKFVGLSALRLNDPAQSNRTSVIYNKGYETKPVLHRTKNLLRRFYQPFNVKLAELLRDKKWLWL